MCHHVSRVSQTYYFDLRRQCAVHRQLGQDTIARVIVALVLLRLDYWNAILAGLPATTLQPLQRAMNAAARTVLDLQPRDHITPAMFHWLPIAARIDYKLCLIVHQSLLGQTPQSISNLLVPVADIPARSKL